MISRRRHSRDPENGQPVAIDPVSGFKVPLSSLVRQWDGEMVAREFVDRRNPQDFVRGVRESIALPYTRPEPPEASIALDIDMEDGTPIFTEDSQPIITQGVVPEL